MPAAEMPRKGTKTDETCQCGECTLGCTEDPLIWQSLVVPLKGFECAMSLCANSASLLADSRVSLASVAESDFTELQCAFPRLHFCEDAPVGCQLHLYHWTSITDAGGPLSL